jgi:enoyl-CoA hydratase/carnithine racemase
MDGTTGIDSGTQRVIARREGAVGWLVLNNPARHNAISLVMYGAIERVIAAFAADPQVRVIVITGAGERAFVSGADISEFAEKRATPAQIAEYDGLSERASVALRQWRNPLSPRSGAIASAAGSIWRCVRI